MAHDHNAATRKWYRNLSPEKKAEYNRKSMERTRKYRATKREVPAITPRKCEVCGKEFLPPIYNRHAKYCSDECRKDAANALRRARRGSDGTRVLPLRKRVCAGCGKEFETRANNVKFCSRSCYMKFRLARERAEYVSQKMVVKRACAFCGNEFETRNGNMRFCSDKCRRHAQYHVSKEAMEQKISQREEAARARAIVESGGMTIEQRNAVIRAQSGDRDELWRASQSWTPAQRKFAQERWEELHPSHQTFWFA